MLEPIVHGLESQVKTANEQLRYTQNELRGRDRTITALREELQRFRATSSLGDQSLLTPVRRIQSTPRPFSELQSPCRTPQVSFARGYHQ